MASPLEAKLAEISSQDCYAGGRNEPVVQKTEEYPDGTIKHIISCKKCRNHFELEV